MVLLLIDREFDFGSRPPSGQIATLGTHWLERENWLVHEIGITPVPSVGDEKSLI